MERSIHNCGQDRPSELQDPINWRITNSHCALQSHQTLLWPTDNQPTTKASPRSPDTSESAGDTTPTTPSAAVAARDTSAVLYSDVLAGRAPVGGYTSAEGAPAHTRTHPQRDRRSPNWYGDVVSH